jgi:cellulose synthase operon protein C
MRAGDSAAAEQSFRKAVQMRADYLPASEQLAALLVQQQRADDALKVARELMTQKPDLINGYVLEAQTLSAAKRWPDAVSSWQKVSQKFHSPQAVMGVYSAFAAQGKEEEGQKVASDWIRSNPKDTVVRGFLAERAMEKKDFRQAQVQYSAILAVAPNSPLVMNNLAWVMHEQKDPRALDHAQAAIKLAPKSPAIMDTLGRIMLDRGQSQRGIELLKQAVDLAPKLPELHLSYARGLSQVGDKSGAQREGEKAIELAQQDSLLRREAELFVKSL